jgi:hypothetical protein
MNELLIILWSIVGVLGAALVSVILSSLAIGVVKGIIKGLREDKNK